MKRLSVLLLILVLGLINTAYSQPKFTITLTGGYGVPLGDFKVAVPPTSPLTETNRADADFFPYYTKQLINFGLDGKLAIGKKGNFRVTFGVGYNMFSNSTDAVFRIDTNNTLGVITFKPKVNIITLALGGEWAFMPKGKINPYVGVGMTGNFFGGKFQFSQPVKVKGAMRPESMDMKSETRIGVQLNAGLDFKLSKQFGANVGVKYHIINVLGKGADNEAEVGPNEIDLGDKTHTMDDGTTSPDKTLSSFLGYVGVSFYFGAPKTTVKK